MDRSGYVLVLRLDEGAAKAVIANFPGAPTGVLQSSPFEYRMAFPAQGQLVQSRMRLNRYDGKLEREFGDEPFSDDGLSVRPGNVFQLGHCEKVPEGPLF